MGEPSRDVRDQARERLRETTWDSMKDAAKATGVIAGIALAACAVAAQIGGMKVAYMIAVLVVVVAAFPVLWLVIDVRRLGRCRDALHAVLGDERLFDELLAEARAERDAARRRCGELEMSITATQIMGSLMAARGRDDD